jgi:integral membrane protein
MHGSNTAVDIAGQVHGTIFLIYIVSVFVFCASLRWTRRQTVIAALASIPPYGTLVFEKYMAHKRHTAALKSQRQVVVRGIIFHDNELLLMQPKDSGFWCLPGGEVTEHESLEAALARTIQAQTTIVPSSARLLYVHQYRHRGVDRIEFFYQIQNNAAYRAVSLDKKTPGQRDIDELEFRSLKNTSDIEPKFLLAEPLSIITSAAHWDTKFIADNLS